MRRRDFLKKGVFYSLLVGLYTSTIGRISKAIAQRPAPRAAAGYDLVAVRGGEPVAMYRRAIQELGGMQRYVKSGQRVVVKPNMAWDLPPERGANTNPELVGAIVRDCFAAGASRVFVFDHTVDQWQRAYTNSGIEQAAREAGALVVPGNLERDYQEVQIPGARRLRTARVHQQIIEADVVINVPILKHHGSTTVTIAMKNLMGIVWDRRFWHLNDLHQCIADFCLYRKPDLNIVDGYLVMTRNGPRGTSTADLTVMKSLIISSDIVAADAASTLIFGQQPRDIGHIRIGAEMGIGQMNLEALNIKRIAI
ncbi:MAG TPA: DUF362 domain-containing protein [Bacteroidales bacterium]|nr:DUF362 domain-containing protein [Bacteroidales bacterium]